MAEFTHDCDRCRFLGTAILMGRTFDYYFCKDIAEGTIIARYGSDGPEYSSSLIHLVKRDAHTFGKFWGSVYRYGLTLL